MRFAAFTFLGVLALAAPAVAAAVGDASADVGVAAPAYENRKGPIVAVDGGHMNYHTVEGRFGPFAKLLSNDGFRVMAHSGAFTADTLSGVSILVIANALNPANAVQWSLPTPSAFTAGEIAAVKSFVENGGSLLLIADHMPFSGAASDLAAAFGVTFFNGFAFHMPEPRPVDVFTATDGSLGRDIVLLGRLSSGNVTRVATFTGSAFRAPDAARRLLILTDDYQVVMPQTAWVFSPWTPRVGGGGLLQGAVMPYGRGRLAVFGEAAMFTAQIEDSTGARIGFTAPGAEGNKQFVLNVAHWLAGLLGP